jgi:hypothetical protein
MAVAVFWSIKIPVWVLQAYGSMKRKIQEFFLKTLPKATPLRRTIQCPDGIICISLIFKLDKRKP